MGGVYPQTHKGSVASHTKQPGILGSSTILSASLLLGALRHVFHKEIELLMPIQPDNTVRLGWQKCMAKSEVWIWELSVGGWDMSFSVGSFYEGEEVLLVLVAY